MDLKGSYVMFGITPISSIESSEVENVLISLKLSELQKQFNGHFWRSGPCVSNGEIFKVIGFDLDLKYAQYDPKMAWNSVRRIKMDVLAWFILKLNDTRT